MRIARIVADSMLPGLDEWFMTSARPRPAYMLRLIVAAERIADPYQRSLDCVACYGTVRSHQEDCPV